MLDDKQLAVADYDRALLLCPNDVMVLLRRGKAKATLGEPKAALEDFDRAIAFDTLGPPDQGRRVRAATAYLARANTRWKSGDSRGAIEDCGRGIELDPTNVELWENRGCAWLATNDQRRAIADLDQALAIDGRRYASLYARADAKGKIGDFDGAISDLDALLRLAPPDADVLSRRGQAYAAKGEASLAIADLEHAVELAPNALEAGSWKAMIVELGRGERR
jgi:tetratricopeptide (TPR) repeat protein